MWKPRSRPLKARDHHQAFHAIRESVDQKIKIIVSAQDQEFLRYASEIGNNLHEARELIRRLIRLGCHRTAKRLMRVNREQRNKLVTLVREHGGDISSFCSHEEFQKMNAAYERKSTEFHM